MLITRRRVERMTRSNCSKCLSTGALSDGAGNVTDLCSCVYEAIFSACLSRYHTLTPWSAPVSVQGIHTSRPWEEYRADFMLLVSKCIGPSGYRDDKPPTPYREVFDLHFIQGKSAQECRRILNLEAPAFEKRRREVRQRCGRRFLRTHPYPLFPLDRYFGQQSADMTDPKDYFTYILDGVQTTKLQAGEQIESFSGNCTVETEYGSET
jgi:hypothetical protein